MLSVRKLLRRALIAEGMTRKGGRLGMWEPKVVLVLQYQMCFYSHVWLYCSAVQCAERPSEA